MWRNKRKRAKVKGVILGSLRLSQYFFYFRKVVALFHFVLLSSFSFHFVSYCSRFVDIRRKKLNDLISLLTANMKNESIDDHVMMNIADLIKELNVGEH